MAQEVKKFLDQKGVELLWSKLSLEDYPNNDTLIAVINAIDKNKADKNDIMQADWEINDETSAAYVKNRTHYETNRIIEWDGNTEGLVHSDNLFYKVSDYIPTDEELLGGTFTILDYVGQFGTAPFLVERTIEYNDFVDSFESFRAVLLFDQIYGIVVAKQNNILGPHDRVFPEKGIYFLSLGGGPASLTLNSTEIKQLNKKFIPTITLDRIDEICGIEPVMTLVVDEDGDAVINAGFPDNEGNLII